MSKKGSPPAPWFGRVTSKIVIKALSKRKSPEAGDGKSKRFFFLYSFCSALLRRFVNTKVYALFQKILAWIAQKLLAFFDRPHYPTFILLFGIYFCLWHPGLDNRFIPQNLPTKTTSKKLRLEARPHIYPTKSVYINISQSAKWLDLFMKEKKVLSCPIHIAGVPIGEYEILEIQEAEQGEICMLLGNEKTNPKGIRMVLSSLAMEGHGVAYIQVPEDFWEMLHPYLRLENPIFVK